LETIICKTPIYQIKPNQFNMKSKITKMKTTFYLLLSAFCFLHLSLKAQNDTLIINATEKTEMKQLKEELDNNVIEIKKLKKLKVSGYIQAQFEVGQEFATTRVGNPTTYDSKRDGKSSDFIRFGIRRGRIKFTWEESFGSAVFQLDITERAIALQEVYFKVSEPWLNIASLTVGVFNRPFGDEIAYSSSRRESPERTVLYQELFPGSKDLGAMVTLAAPKGTPVEGLELDAGAFCGNGIAVPDNGKIDFIGHLKYNKKWSKITVGLGASAYIGTVRNQDSLLYTVINGKWERGDSIAGNRKNARQYVGFDAQFSAKTSWGFSNIRAEVLFGKQPSTQNSFRSPNRDLMQFGNGVMFNRIRNFWGAHLYFVQDIYKTPLTVVLKYAYMNPNTKLKREEVKSITDLAYHYLGAGLLVRCTSNLRLLCFYELPFNSTKNGFETPDENVLDYTKHVKEGVFTCRLQYRF